MPAPADPEHIAEKENPEAPLALDLRLCGDELGERRVAAIARRRAEADDGAGLRLVLLGVTAGLVAFAPTRVMVSLLFGISAIDPLTFIAISLVLLIVAMLASYIPSLCAMRVDAMVALRYQ